MCPDGREKIFAMHSLSIKHRNTSYDYENNNKKGKNQKRSRKVREEIVEAI